MEVRVRKITVKSIVPVKELQNSRDNNWKKVKNYIEEYCMSSSIHGVRYFGEQRCTIFEKIWWFLAIAISCWFCFTCILEAYEKWQRTPVIVSFATEPMQIWQIPFPAVTICPDFKFNPKVFNFTAMYYKKLDNEPLTEEEAVHFDYLSLICSPIRVSEHVTNFVKADDIYDFFDKMTHSALDFYGGIEFMRDFYPFREMFSRVITDEGVCYSFNILDRKEIYTEAAKQYKDYQVSKFEKSRWNLENGYDGHADADVYPKRALFAEASWSLEVYLILDTTSFDFLCTTGLHGYKVQIHNPAKLPRVRQQFFRVPLDQIVVAAVTPSLLITSNDVKQYSPEKRKCFFFHERPLRFYRFYTQENCMMECKTNYSFKYCGCVNFFMPHDENMLICGAAKIPCLIEAESIFVNSYINSKLGKSTGKRNDGSTYDCNCLPSCTSLEYPIELSQNSYDWEKNFEASHMKQFLNYSLTKSNFHMSHLQIFFKTESFYPSLRHQLFGMTDFLANFGGLLGFFIGFSVLSLVEIVYFLTVRILCSNCDGDQRNKTVHASVTYEPKIMRRHAKY